MKRKNKKILSTIFFLLLFLLLYSPINELLEEKFEQSETVFVERVVDGDTIKTSGMTIRLLGINTPEKGEEYYTEAKNFLEKQILNKTIELKFGKQKIDLYNRTLAYVFFQGENINQKIISNGFANAYFPSGKDTYFSLFIQEWEKCVEKGINYCEKSKNICTSCIELKQLDYNSQKVILKNNCGFSCNLTNWEIKDEGRKKFYFPEFILKPNEEISIIVGENSVDNVLLWKKETYVWTKTGDTLFLRDNQNKLVLWKNY
jgi:micrococcal nuclease